MRFTVLTLTVAALISAASTAAAVEVVRGQDEVTLTSGDCSVVVDTSRGCAAIRQVRLPNDKDNLVKNATAALYFTEGKHWVDESWMKASKTSVREIALGKSVQAQVKDFGGFLLTKDVALRDDGPQIVVSYTLKAIRQTKPELICPAGLALPVELDTVATADGRLQAHDLKTDDFALKLDAPWYGFLSRATGKGVVLAPLATPDMYKVKWIGHKADGSLQLVWRLHPMRTFEEGDEVRFAYSIVPFDGSIQEASKLALAARSQLAALVEVKPEPGAGPADLAKGLRVAYCPAFAQAPHVDGRLDDACWEQAGVIDKLLTIDGKRWGQAATTAYIGRDEANLYVGVRCEEPLMRELRTDAQPGSTQVWTDDCVELFIECGAPNAGYAHLIINAAGVRQDNLPGERPITYTWTAATSRQEASWSVEVRVPFVDLGVEPPAEGRSWRLNLCRSRLPKREATCWSPTFKDFHVPERFGVMVFGSPMVRVRQVAPGLVAETEERTFSIKLENLSKAQAAVSGGFSLHLGDTQLAASKLTAELAPGATTWLETPYEVQATGLHTVGVRLSDASDGRAVFDGAFRGVIYSAGLNSSIYPCEDDANRLHVARDTMQHFFFVPANHSKTTRDAFSFVLIMPEGVDVTQASGDALKMYYRPTLESRKPVTRDGLKMVEWVWKADRALGSRDIKKVRFYSTWCGALTVDEGLAEGEHPFYFYLQSGDEREAEHAATLVVLPKPEGSQPQTIAIGMSMWTASPTPEFWAGLLDTYRRCGMNTLDGAHMLSKGEQWFKPVLERNMRPWRLMYWYWWNDPYIEAHPEHAAVTFDGKPDEKRICPEIMAGEGEAIAGVMASLVNQVREGATLGTWWDLEGPGCFDACFCPRCIEAFRKTAGLPEDEELTPLRIQAKYGDQWVDFACGQSARIAARMRDYARAHDSQWKLAVYCALQNEHTRRAYRVDWDVLTPHIDVATPSFYSYSVSDLAKRFTSGVTDFVRYIQGMKDIPVWNTLTTGYGRGGQYVSDGRLTKMQIVKSVAYGAQGTFQWWWGPVDGRHYHAYARASSTISRLERFFTDGTMAPGLLSGEQPPGTSRVAWQLGDSLLVMLFNDAVGEPRQARARIPVGFRITRDDGRAEIDLQQGVVSATVAPLDYRWVILSK